MKVSFLISNPYVEIEPYLRVASILASRGINVCFYHYVKLPLVSERLAGSYQTKKIPIIGDHEAKKSNLLKIVQIVCFLIDKYIIRYFIGREEPDLVVMDGDITDAYGRLFIDLCRRYHVGILLVPLLMPGSAIVNPDPNKNIPLAGLARKVLRLFALERAVFFRNWVVGSYHDECNIITSNGEANELLLSNGIKKNRLFLLGNPSYDRH